MLSWAMYLHFPKGRHTANQITKDTVYKRRQRDVINNIHTIQIHDCLELVRKRVLRITKQFLVNTTHTYHNCDIGDAGCVDTIKFIWDNTLSTYLVNIPVSKDKVLLENTTCQKSPPA